MSGTPLIGRQNGAFATSAAAAWPNELCHWAAQAIIAAYQEYRAAAGVGNEEREELEEPKSQKRKLAEKEDDEEEQKVNPMGAEYKGGVGRPRACQWKGFLTPFHDGGGLPSPGRWPRGKRKYPDSDNWRRMRARLMEALEDEAGGRAEFEKEFFKMARGGSFRLARDETVLEKVRKCIKEGLGLEEEVGKVHPGQPLFLVMMRRILEEAGDVDYEFLERAQVCLPLGIKEGLPRNPKVFEKQTKWALEDDPAVEWAFTKDNYVSAIQHQDHLREHLESEVRDGLMSKMEEPEFIKKYGSDRAVAALAVLVEDEATGKRRVIHDGTHDIGVNNRIRCRDKVRMPGPREKRCILEELSQEKVTSKRLIGGSCTKNLREGTWGAGQKMEEARSTSTTSAPLALVPPRIGGRGSAGHY